MKKLLVIFCAIAMVAATSCKKDAETAPAKATTKTASKKDVGSWD